MPRLIPDVARHFETTCPKPELLHPRLLFLVLVAAIGNCHARGYHARIDIAGVAAADDQKPVVTIPLASPALGAFVRNQLLQTALGKSAAGPVLSCPLACLRQFRRVNALQPHALALKSKAVAIGGMEGPLMLDVGPVVELGRD